jgi:hypothetical protein
LYACRVFTDKKLYSFLGKNFEKKSSIIRQCYDALKKGMNCPKMKLNWAKDFFELLKKYECENLLCLDSLNFENSQSDVYIKVSSVLQEIRGKMTQNDIIRMKNSQLIPHLWKTKSHVQVESLYNINCKWSLVKLAVNLKANLGRLPVAGRSLVLATNNSFFDPDKDTKCKSCGDDYDEDAYHVLYECTKYIDSRTKLIAHLPKPENREFLPNLIESISVKELTKFECFLAQMIETKIN